MVLKEKGQAHTEPAGYVELLELHGAAEGRVEKGQVEHPAQLQGHGSWCFSSQRRKFFSLLKVGAGIVATTQE